MEWRPSKAIKASGVWDLRMWERTTCRKEGERGGGCVCVCVCVLSHRANLFGPLYYTSHSCSIL